MIMHGMIRRYPPGPVLPLAERMEENEALVRNLEIFLNEHKEMLISLQEQVNRRTMEAEMATLRAEMAGLRTVVEDMI